jgi:hypothetical protein
MGRVAADRQGQTRVWVHRKGTKLKRKIYVSLILYTFLSYTTITSCLLLERQFSGILNIRYRDPLERRPALSLNEDGFGALLLSMEAIPAAQGVEHSRQKDLIADGEA